MRRPRAVSSRTERAIARLGADRTRGARALSSSALTVLARELAGRTKPAASTVTLRLGSLAVALRRAQPAMGPFRRWSEELRSLSVSRPPTRRQARAVRWAARERERLRSEPRGVARTLRSKLPPRAAVLTMSRSASLLDALGSLPLSRRPRSVVVLESRPGGEGRRFARDLRAIGISARAVADRRRRAAAERAEMVLVGADAVTKGGTLIHKVGTLPLARAAAKAGRPFVTVFGESKRLPGRVRLGGLPTRFDRTARRWITAYWSDRGARAGGRRRGGAR